MGDRLRCSSSFPKTPVTNATSMLSAELDVIFEDNHLLVLSKPAGLPTMGIADQTESLLGAAKHYIRRKYHKPGNVYLGVVSRLDALVSGVIVFARTSKAAARLNRQFQTGAVKKTYWAVVSGIVKADKDTLEDWIGKNEKLHRMQIVTQQTKDARQAILSFQTLRREQVYSLLEINLHTGRKHQIRLQLANIGHPILGDKKYGSDRPFSKGIALHSRTLTLTHPTLKEDMTFQTSPPSSWDRFKLDV